MNIHEAVSFLVEVSRVIDGTNHEKVSSFMTERNGLVVHVYHPHMYEQVLTINVEASLYLGFAHFLVEVEYDSYDGMTHPVRRYSELSNKLVGAIVMYWIATQAPVSAVDDKMVSVLAKLLI